MDSEVYEIIYNYLATKKVNNGDRFKKNWNFIKSCNRFKIENQALYYGNTGREVILEKDLEKTILYDHVDNESGVHNSYDKTYIPLKKFYWWPDMVESIESFIANCQVCNTEKEKKRKVSELKKKYNWKNLTTDFVGPFKETISGNKYVLIITNILENWTEYTPLSDLNSDTITIAVINLLCLRYGFTEDNKLEDSTDFIHKLLSFLIYCIPTNLSNLADKKNKMICEFFSTMVERQKSKDWDCFLLGKRMTGLNRFSQRLYHQFIILTKNSDKVNEISQYEREFEKETSIEAVDKNIEIIDKSNNEIIDKSNNNEINKNNEIIDKSNNNEINKNNEIIDKNIEMIDKSNNEMIDKSNHNETNKNNEMIDKSNHNETNKNNEMIDKSNHNILVDQENYEPSIKPRVVPKDPQYNSLLPGRWLDDRVINDYIERLMRGTLYRIINSLTIVIILSSESKKISEILTKNNLVFHDDEEEDILGVMCVENNHWIAIHIRPNSFLKYYDPLGVDRYDILYKLIILMDKEFTYPIIRSNFLEQKDSYNCGVYSCFYLDVISTKRSRKGFDPDEYRYEMITELNKIK